MSSESVSGRQVVERFGGVKALAALLDKPPSTIRNWNSGEVPPLWHSRLLRLAREHGVDLTVDELLATKRK